VRRAYKTVYREGHTLEEARSILADAALVTPVIAPLVEFLAEPGRGIIR
jgi:UDP-N-acetylglucosamine acyltransferase